MQKANKRSWLANEKRQSSKEYDKAVNAVSRRSQRQTVYTELCSVRFLLMLSIRRRHAQCIPLLRSLLIRVVLMLLLLLATDGTYPMPVVIALSRSMCVSENGLCEHMRCKTPKRQGSSVPFGILCAANPIDLYVVFGILFATFGTSYKGIFLSFFHLCVDTTSTNVGLLSCAIHTHRHATKTTSAVVAAAKNTENVHKRGDKTHSVSRTHTHPIRCFSLHGYLLFVESLPQQNKISHFAMDCATDS